MLWSQTALMVEVRAYLIWRQILLAPSRGRTLLLSGLLEKLITFGFPARLRTLGQL
jgi:hypothetical protein